MTTILKTGAGFTVLEGAKSEDFVFQQGKCDFDTNNRGELEFTSAGLRKLEKLGLWKLELADGKLSNRPPNASEFFAAAKIAKPAPPPPPAPPPMSAAAAQKIVADAAAAYAAKNPPKSEAYSVEELVARINGKKR